MDYGPKLVHLAEVSPYFRRTASVLHAGEFFWRIKRFEWEDFLFKVPCRRIDNCIMYNHVLCIIVPSSGPPVVTTTRNKQCEDNLLTACE